jgi:hypothetical protein
VSMSVPAYRWQARRDDYTRAIVAGASDVSRVRNNRTRLSRGPHR